MGVIVTGVSTTAKGVGEKAWGSCRMERDESQGPNLMELSHVKT